MGLDSHTHTGGDGLTVPGYHQATVTASPRTLRTPLGDRKAAYVDASSPPNRTREPLKAWLVPSGGGPTMSTFVYSAPVPLACPASAVTAPPKTAGAVLFRLGGET